MRISRWKFRNLLRKKSQAPAYPPMSKHDCQVFGLPDIDEMYWGSSDRCRICNAEWEVAGTSDGRAYWARVES